MIPLNTQRLQKIFLELNMHHPIDIHVVASVDSTQNFVKALPHTSKLSLCCAEMQTQGRGRFDRTWHSPFGENMYASLRMPINSPQHIGSGLSLVVSLGLVEAIKKITDNHDALRIKWPNDVIWNNRKLAGSLIECLTEQRCTKAFVLGIGLNVNMPSDVGHEIEQPWCSLHDIIGSPLDRNHVIAQVITCVHEHITRFMQQGMTAFQQAWRDVDDLFGHPIVVVQPSRTLQGIAHGINDQGHLIMIDDNGQRHQILSGEATKVRAIRQ